MAAAGSPTNGVRIVVAGDAKTGKTSLIVTAAAGNFPSDAPPVVPSTRLRLPEDLDPDRLAVTIIDTSSSPENRDRLVEEFMEADAVILTCAYDRPETLDRLSSYWLPELRRLDVRLPIIVVGCMLDKREDQQPTSLQQVMSPIMQQFREIETYIECSALYHIQIPAVFYCAKKAALYPTAPLYDLEKHVLRPRCVWALKRIFILCDQDRALSDAEMNDFQVFCFSTHSIEKGHLEAIWTVLRKFGFNNEIRLRDDQLPPPINPDQDGALRTVEPEEPPSTAPESPLNEAPYEDVDAEKTFVGCLSLEGFSSLMCTQFVFQQFETFYERFKAKKS